MGRKITVLALVAALSGVVGLTAPVNAQVSTSATKAASATVTAKISGAPAGARMLAVLSNGASAYASISGGRFTVKLPKVKGSTASVSLHLVNAKQSYAGSISFGRVKGKKTSWFGRVTVKNGVKTSLPKITFSSNFGAVKMTGSAAKLTLAGALKKAAANGKPAGAGRLGLAGTRAVSSKGVRAATVRTAAVHIAEATATGPGDDLDGDGIPNSLDIDDDGDGYPDPVDQSAGVNGSAPTAKYDAFSSLGSSIGNGPNRMTSPINYNFLRNVYPNTADLMKELSLLNDANFFMTVRGVAPFFSEDPTAYIKAAWIDCTGLAWCLADDNQTDPSNFVAAPRLLPYGDGDISPIWQYAYTKTPGSQCDVHSMNSCKSVLWSSFTMKNFLQLSKDNGNSRITTDVIGTVGDQPKVGFGLYDPYVLNGPPSGGGKNTNSAGFDLNAFINPRGYGKFLDNLKPGDVFTVNALMSDGNTSSIAMTVAPYFVTAPAVTSFAPAGLPTINVDYAAADPKCASHQGNEDCRIGSEGNPFKIDSANPSLTVTFWRPQRLRISGADDAIAGGEPLVDMGGLDYRVSVQGGDGSPFRECPNTAVKFTNSDGGSWSEVPKPNNPMSNDRDYMKDGSADAQASVTRTVSLQIDFSKCTGLSTSASSQKYSVRLEADSQPTFGGQRGSTYQTFYFGFSSFG